MNWNNRSKQNCLKYLQMDNVVGTGLGLKEKNGVRSSESALVFLVKKKIPKTMLTRFEVLPKKIEDMNTDVIEVGELRLLDVKGKMRPAVPGISIGHINSTAGTFGALVRNRKNQLFILSNNHVLANATDGRDGRASLNDPILQPGSYDGGTEKDVLGHLYKFVPLHRERVKSFCSKAERFKKVSQFFLNISKRNYRIELYKNTRAENQVDAALAKPVNQRVVHPKIYQLGIPKGIRQAKPGMKVIKSGRTTGVTTGSVKVIEAVVKVAVDDENSIIMSEQIVCSSMGKPGDSGSLIMDQQLKAVGLLCAGSNMATIGNKISNVLTALGVRLVTE
ncbi:S1 family peptidase [Candidatus Contubernalis alkaliaceticus]|uniref:S1 family peptidase n=1 Tax=Candidatus Contubernalis alkaliaceticus TaxID=338645 RepID=UPI001F4C23A7|nr:S1 family peptidase [Candidatus Contubernalis alkalaceticus]UNC90687.1 hypothetical protein HUE98_00470 [Candidatus Contubernalis alkalaceticus]